jgi:hypothetical protein
MHHLPCFALLVLLVGTAKINFKEQVGQAGKAVRPACIVLGLLVLFCAHY